MGRHPKATVDYFPHYVHHGKTIYIIQNLYGNDGYAFFYKLLEVLGDAEGHYYDCRDETSKEFLASQTNVPWISGVGILDKLSKMGIIDTELWEAGIIWMQSFVDSIKDAYRKRSISVPEKPQVSVFLPPEMRNKKISTAGSTQSKVNKSKVEYSTKSTSFPDGKPPQDFLEQIKNNPAYKHIDIDTELAKMDAWLLLPKNKRRQKTPTFILNWLNKIEAPVNGTQPKKPIIGISPEDEKRIREIEEAQNG